MYRQIARTDSIYRITHRLQRGRSADVLCSEIPTTVSAWLAELGVQSPVGGGPCASGPSRRLARRPRDRRVPIGRGDRRVDRSPLSPELELKKRKAQRAPPLLPMRAATRGRDHKGAHHEHQEVTRRSRRDRRRTRSSVRRRRNRTGIDIGQHDHRCVGRHRPRLLVRQPRQRRLVHLHGRTHHRSGRSGLWSPLPHAAERKSRPVVPGHPGRLDLGC